jgi:hypothetical protein
MHQVTQAAAYPKSGFAPCYMKALSGAALVFGLTHAVQAIAVSVFRDGVVHPRLDALLSLSFFELIEALIFFVIGMVMVLVPARVADNYIGRSAAGTVNLFCWLGVLAGITYLPLCAGISTSILPSADDPTYLQRCLEYLLPMVIAGAAGGYIFGSTRRYSSESGL